MRWWDGIIDSMDMSLSKLWEMVKDSHGVLRPWGQKEFDATQQLMTTESGQSEYFVEKIQ